MPVGANAKFYKESPMKKAMLALSVVFTGLTLAGAGYVLSHAGGANAGYAVVPMVAALACLALYRGAK